MCDELIQSGAQMLFVYDPEQEKVKNFTEILKNLDNNKYFFSAKPGFVESAIFAGELNKAGPLEK